MGMFDFLYSSDTKKRLSEAEELNGLAESIVNNAQEHYDKAQVKCEKSLKELEKQKTKAIKGSIILFVNVFTQIKDIDFDETNRFQELGKLRNKTDFFFPMVDISYDMMGGSFARQVMAFSVGGAFGLIGLGVMRHYMKGKSQEIYDNANIAYAEAEVASEKLELAADVLGYVQARADMFVSIMKKLDEMLLPLVYRMEQIIKTKGSDYSNFDRYERQTLASAMSLACSLKAIVEMNILNKDGSLSQESKTLAANMAQQLQIPFDGNAMGNNEAFPQDDDMDFDDNSDASNVEGYYTRYETVVSVICKVTKHNHDDINLYSKFKELGIKNKEIEKISQILRDKLHVTWPSDSIDKIFESVETLVDYVDDEKNGVFSEIKYYGDVAKKAISNLFGQLVNEVSSTRTANTSIPVKRTSSPKRNSKKNHALKIFIAEKTGIEIDDLYDNASFEDDLGLDDLDRIELLMEIEKEYGISFLDEEMNLECVKDLIDLIESKM